MTISILDKLGYHDKWHLPNSSRMSCSYSINEPIIEYILNTIDIKEGFFIEFGAWDGIVLSNCRKLYENNWSGMFIEADSNKFIDLHNNYKEEEKIIIVNSMIDTDKNKLDTILNKYNIIQVDFCSIDIDGLDLNIFNSMEEILPTIICIEGGQVLFPMEKEKVNLEIQKDNVTQSLYNYITDFEKKGYRILCAYQDIFFVKEKYYNLFSVSQNIYEIYLDGLFNLPRIPWLYEKAQQYQIQNDILEYIILRTNNKNIKNRKIWLRDNYNMLQKIEKELRIKYITN